MNQSEDLPGLVPDVSTPSFLLSDVVADRGECDGDASVVENHTTEGTSSIINEEDKVLTSYNDHNAEQSSNKTKKLKQIENNPISNSYGTRSKGRRENIMSINIPS
jgi:hypothetical protein